MSVPQSLGKEWETRETSEQYMIVEGGESAMPKNLFCASPFPPWYAY